MSEQMMDQEDGGFAFTDEDFERRYTPETASPSASGPSCPANQPAKPLATRIIRSRNKFMRTLIRRRLASSGLT